MPFALVSYKHLVSSERLERSTYHLDLPLAFWFARTTSASSFFVHTSVIVIEVVFIELPQPSFGPASL